MRKLVQWVIVIQVFFVSCTVLAHDMAAPGEKNKHFAIQAGGLKAIYDEDLRDFVDYGETISFGFEQKINKKFSFVTTVDLMRLSGNYHKYGQRIINVSSPGTYTDETGGHYWSGGTLTVINAEALREVSLDTTMYIVPITLGFVRKAQSKGNITPYMGATVGYSFAMRKVDGRAIKESEYNGPLYIIPVNDKDTVDGMTFQVLSGIEKPLKNGNRLLIEMKLSFLDLSDFNSVFERSLVGYTPWVPPGTTQTFEYYEAPYKIGDLREVWVLGLTVGIAF